MQYFRILSVVSVLSMIYGCSSIHSETPQTNALDTAATKQKQADNSPISADDVYQLLLANIAFHRDYDDIALDALSKVAVSTKQPRLLENAIDLAQQRNKPERVTELSHLLLETDPTNQYAQLQLSSLSFNQGENQQGIQYIEQFLTNTHRDDAPTLREVTALIQAQAPETQQQILDTLATTETYNHYLVIAIIHGVNQNDQQYINWLDKTLKIRPDSEYAATLKLGYEMSQKNGIDNVEKFSEDHLNQFQQHENFRMLYVAALIENGKIEQAQKQLKKALKYNPEHNSANYIIGLSYLEQMQYKKAIAYFNKHLTISPADETARLRLAEAQENMGDITDSIATLKRINTDENYFSAQLKIGELLAEHSSVSEGIAHLQKIDTHSSSEKITIALKKEDIYRKQKLYQEALNVLNEALSSYPDNPSLLYNRGYIYAVLENVSQHESDMRKLIAIDPSNADAYNALGYTLADLTNRHTEALELILKANSLSPGNPFILDSLGWIYYRLGDYHSALDNLLQAYTMLKDAEIATHIGEVYWQLDEKQLATDYWERARQLDPENESLHETIKRLLTPETTTSTPI